VGLDIPDVGSLGRHIEVEINHHTNLTCVVVINSFRFQVGMVDISVVSPNAVL